MKDIAEWLVTIEEISGVLYREASETFRADEKFSRFLAHMAEDEAWHFHLIRSATESLREMEGVAAECSILLDEETRAKIKTPFEKNLEDLRNGRLTKDALVDCIASTEFSEWNAIFLYVMNALKDRQPEFRYAIPKIQHHLRHAEHFMESLPGGKEKIRLIRKLPAVWEEKILIAEDRDYIAELLGAILEREGTVRVAENGREALERLREEYFQLVISDVDMPVMNGIEFYRRAVERYPNIRERFLFFCGRPTPEVLAFFKKHGVRYMLKPAPIAEIRRNALEIMHQIVEDE